MTSRDYLVTAPIEPGNPTARSSRTTPSPGYGLPLLLVWVVLFEHWIRLASRPRGGLTHELGLAAWTATPPALAVGLALELLTGGVQLPAGALAPRSGLVATPILLGWLLVLGLRARRPVDIDVAADAHHRTYRVRRGAAPRSRKERPSTTRSRRRARRAAARTVGAAGSPARSRPDSLAQWEVVAMAGSAG